MPARALWTGTVSFGLVNIPVKLYRATTASSAKSVSFHLLHAKCGTRIKNVRWCPHCDEAVEWKQLVKGYEVSKGRYVRVDPKELDEILPDEDFAAVSIEGFITANELDPIYYDRSYYAAPEGLAQGLRAVDARVGRLGPSGDRAGDAADALASGGGAAAEAHLILTTLYFHEEIVPADQIPKLPERELHADRSSWRRRCS